MHSAHHARETVDLLRQETHSLTHCCAWPAEGRSVLHVERSWLAIWAAPTDRPMSSSTCCNQVLRGRPGGRFQSAAGGVPETLDFIPPGLWHPNIPDLNQVDYKIWVIMQHRVYQTKICSMDERRVIDVWCDLEQSTISTWLAHTSWLKTSNWRAMNDVGVY